MKKLIISLVLAALMTLVLAVPAFAGGRGSVVTGNGRCQVLAKPITCGISGLSVGTLLDTRRPGDQQHQKQQYGLRKTVVAI